MNKRFWWRDLREADHLENLGIDVGIILKCIFSRWDWEAWAWVALAEDRDVWRALVNAVMFL